MATRLYYQSANTPEVNPPAPDASWEHEAPDVAAVDLYGTISPVKNTSAVQTASMRGNGTDPNDVLLQQFVSPRLKEQTISGTVKGQMRALEDAAAADARAQIVIRVISEDGTTVRATILSSDTAAEGTYTEFASAGTYTNRQLPGGGSKALTSTICQAGDRLLVEIGVRVHSTDTTNAPRWRSLCAPASNDLPENETDTTELNPWLEFSGNLAFYSDDDDYVERGEPADDTGIDPASQALTNPGGFLQAHSDFTLFGLYNGHFGKGPPNPSANITPHGGTGSNFMPNWRFVQSSNTTMTATQITNSQSPSGSNFRFTGTSVVSGHEAFIEQLTPVAGTASRSMGTWGRLAYSTAGIPSSTLSISFQYLRADYRPTAGESTTSAAAISGTLSNQLLYGTVGAVAPPLDAFYLRTRIRWAAGASGSGTIDLHDIRLDHGHPFTVFPDISTPGTYAPGVIYQSDGAILIRPTEFAGVATAQVSVSDTAEAVKIVGGTVFASVITPTVSGAVNNYAPTGITSASVVAITVSGGPHNITGLDATGWEEGEMKFFAINAGQVNLQHGSASSTSGNRFGLATATAKNIDRGGFIVVYSPTASAANPFRVIALSL